jgi:hypothetical protein
MSKLFTTILPSLLAGGLLFGSALTGAQPVPPTPPTPPAARPPKPPKPPKAPTIHIDLGQIDQIVDEQIEHALESISDNEQIPPHVRQAVKQRLEKVRTKVKLRIAKVGANDLDGLKVELNNMVEELGQEMEQFGKEMEKWSKDFEKQMEQQIEAKMKQRRIIIKGRGPVDPWSGQVAKPDAADTWSGPVIADTPDLPDMVDMADMDDLSDMADVMKSMGRLKLQPGQRQQLQQLRADSDAKVEKAKQQLERASERLRNQLEDHRASEQEISASIDNVTRLEADIRKARILAWVNARRVLDDLQRQKIEGAVRGRSK